MVGFAAGETGGGAGTLFGMKIKPLRLSELAQQKASSAQVKEFAKMMVADHTKANDELKMIATKKGIILPTDLAKKDQMAMDKLSKLSGADFDKAYSAEMHKDHVKTVAEFEEASKTVKDPELKGFAEKTLPTLRAHLEKAKGMHGEKS